MARGTSGAQQGWVLRERGSSLQARAWDPVARKYTAKTFPIGARNEAVAWAKDQHARFRVGLDRAGPRGVATDLVRQAWIDALTRRKRNPQHIHDTDFLLRRWGTAVPDAAAPQAAALTDRWLAGLGLSAASHNRYLVCIRAACRHAVDLGLLARNPTDKIDRFELDHEVKEQFRVDELARLLRLVDDPYHRRFAVLVYTGMRVREAAALQWEDIDWGGRVVQVQLREGVRVKRRRERLIPLADELAAILEPHRREQGPVTERGMANLQREFDRFLERAGCTRPGLSPHSCRHTYAGLMTATGVPSLLLAAHMGHRSVATTAGYAELAARFERAVVGWGRGELRLLTGWTSPWPRQVGQAVTV